MKILYLSCHSVLEYDEVKLFHELGYEIFSPGAYLDPSGGDLRPEIPGLVYDPDILEQFHRICGNHPGEDAKDYLTPEFVDNFDTVIIMHTPRWVQRNWNAIKNKRVIWRTIGQSVASTEASLRPYRDQGMEIVRYSPQEIHIPGFIGQDAMIRFYKDPQEYKGWTGIRKRVINFTQDMQKRDGACNFTFFEQVTRPFPRGLYGIGSENLPWGHGKVPFPDLKQAMRDNRAYFYTGTHPASYTLNFIEAWMTGIPIVAIGEDKGNAEWCRNHKLYEIPSLITNHQDGFWGDDLLQLRNFLDLLINNDNIARVISTNARQSAIRHFGKDMIGNAWKAYLDGGNSE